MSKRLAVAVVFLLAVAAPLSAGTLDRDMLLLQEVRGIRFDGPVVERTITREEFRAYFADQMERGLELPVESYFRVLRVLQLMDTRADPGDELLDLYESQVLAFYDPGVHTYFQIDAPPDDVKLPALFANLVTVHELMHALQDQHFDAGATLESLHGNWDAQLAYQSVLEGEATLVMYAALYKRLGKSLDSLLEDDLLTRTMAESGSMSLGIAPDAPKYFVESMKFPYIEGVKFVVEAYRRGGWPAVDRLHQRPPSTTAQILDPALYFDPECAALPTAILPTGNAMLSTQLGEFHWRFLVGDDASRGWEADSVRVLDGKRPTVLVDTTWSSPDDAAQFATAYNAFLKHHAVDPRMHVAGNRVRAAYGGDSSAIAAFVK